MRRRALSIRGPPGSGAHLPRSAPQSPADGDALHLLGLIRLIAADYASARDFLQQAATAAPEDHLCHYNLGEAYRCLGLFAEAVESYEKAIALRPAFTEARNNLGIVLADLGLIDAALQSYEQALLTAPDSVRTLMNLGNVLHRDRPVARGRHLLRARYIPRCRLPGGLPRVLPRVRRPGKTRRRIDAPRESPRDPPRCICYALNNLGEALQDLDRTDEALGVYDRALLIDPYSARTHHSRGLLLESLGRIDEAYRSLRKGSAP